MKYSPSPRPSFDRATVIPYASVTKHLWGDKESGEVADWIYVSSSKVHCLVFGLPPQGWFRHSDSFRTIFGADVTYLVLSGVMVIANPETGEVHRALTGDVAFFRRDTWHHVYSYSAEPLRVLEFFAPPPSSGTSGAYAKEKSLLVNNKYTRDEWLGQLPMENMKLRHANTIRIVREADMEWRLHGTEFPTLVGLVVSTEHLTVGKMLILPGQNTAPETHGGDEAIYVTEGTLNMRVHDGQLPNWFEMKVGDGCFIPQGTPHEYYNINSGQASAVFGVAPNYPA